MMYHRLGGHAFQARDEIRGHGLRAAWVCAVHVVDTVCHAGINFQKELFIHTGI